MLVESRPEELVQGTWQRPCKLEPECQPLLEAQQPEPATATATNRSPRVVGTRVPRDALDLAERRRRREQVLVARWNAAAPAREELAPVLESLRDARTAAGLRDGVRLWVKGFGKGTHLGQHHGVHTIDFDNCNFKKGRKGDVAYGSVRQQQRQQQLKCAACGFNKTPSSFSLNQIRKMAARRCKQCVNGVAQGTATTGFQFQPQQNGIRQLRLAARTGWSVLPPPHLEDAFRRAMCLGLLPRPDSEQEREGLLAFFGGPAWFAGLRGGRLGRFAASRGRTALVCTSLQYTLAQKLDAAR